MESVSQVRLLILAAALAPGGALAQAESKWYAGFTASAAHAALDDGSIPITGSPATLVSKDLTSSALALFGGYQFNPSFALEAGFMDLGRYRITRSLVAPAIGTGDISLKSSGWFADAVGFRALSPTWSLFGKLGAMYTTTEATLTPSGAVLLPAGTDLNPKRSEWNFKFGFGAQYAFSKDMALRFGYDQVSSVGDANTGQGDVRLFSLGLRIGF